MSIMLTLSACSLAGSGSSPQPTPTTSNAASPSSSVGVACEEPFTHLVPSEATEVLPGMPVRVRIEGFPANAPVMMSVGPASDPPPGTPIGGTTTDQQGSGFVSGVIPADSPPGDASIWVMTSEGCGSSSLVFVVGSLEGISIDDDTVVPGQRVTITAGGLAPDGIVALHVDCDGLDALTPCPALATAQATPAGSVVMAIAIPRDLARGAHYLVLNGTSFDDTSDLSLVVQITVG